MSSTSQDTIKKWFDQTYRTRGFQYLRPIGAYEIFATILGTKQGHKHLDVACGLGLLLKCFANKGAEVTGIDLSTQGVQMAKEYCPEARIEVGNAEALPYEDESFDSLTCIGSIERMLNREKALTEALRVCKKGAGICFMVRNSENFTWRVIQNPLGLRNRKGHQDALNLKEWTALFESVGYEIERVYPDHWPYYRFLKTIMPWRKIDTGRILKFPFSINSAYEYIFLLKKPL